MEFLPPQLLSAAAPEASNVAFTLIMIGVFMLVGFSAHVIGRRTHVPRVTILLLVGFLAGPTIFNLIPEETSEWFPLIARIALSIIGFQLGERFLGKALRRTGKTDVILSLAVAIAASLIVFVALLLAGVTIPVALLLAGIAPATAPAATVDVIRETKAKGPVTETVESVVAIDDAWGVIIFSLLLVAAEFVTQQSISPAILLFGVWEVVGGIMLGVIIGLPMALLTGRVRRGELTLIETLGFVFLCCGLALALQLSYIIACLAMGATVSNLAKHHERPFHAIEEVEQPFLIVFFLLAGFEFDFGALQSVGIAGLVYLAARSAGKIAGGYAGAVMARAPATVRSHTGLCLLPQAGVALGLALIVTERFPELGAQVLPIIVGTTIIFEIIGPIVTRLTLQHAGELDQEQR